MSQGKFFIYFFKSYIETGKECLTYLGVFEPSENIHVPTAWEK